MPFTDDELLTELRELADTLGHVPTLQEYRNEGSHSATTYYNRFGSWRDALDAAGLTPHDPDTKIPKSDLLAEIHRLADQLGTIPTAREMDTQGEYWTSTYRNAFGSWGNALEAAGYESRAEHPQIPTEDLLREINQLASELGRRPRVLDVKEKGTHAYSTYVRRFGSWSKALEAADWEE